MPNCSHAACKTLSLVPYLPLHPKAHQFTPQRQVLLSHTVSRRWNVNETQDFSFAHGDFVVNLILEHSCLLHHLWVKCTDSMETTPQVSLLPKTVALGCKHMLFLPPSTFDPKPFFFNLNYAVTQANRWDAGGPTWELPGVGWVCRPCM